jgi:hypothetical protein
MSWLRELAEGVSEQIVAAALIAIVAILWNFNTRLTKIETLLSGQHKQEFTYHERQP